MHLLTSPPHFFLSFYLLTETKRAETIFLKLNTVVFDDFFILSHFSSKSKKNKRALT